MNYQHTLCSIWARNPAMQRSMIMRRRALGVAIVAAVLSTAAILYRTLQPDTCDIDDILAVY